MTFAQRASGSCWKHQSHLQARAVLRIKRFPIPRPPSRLGSFTWFQATSGHEAWPSHRFHRKSRIIFSALLAIPTGSRKSDMKYVGMESRTEAINVTLPPLDKKPRFHPSNLRAIFRRTDSQKSASSGEPPNGIPRYFMGQVPT
ncbi:hypothetical protein Scep_001911 [Stephania cephalantha]|uniref:Uncharacterized protein n=1 Tax=Stephania cephalantha TaxID=152367 RepID=A0AAP0Q477_9MAGN